MPTAAPPIVGTPTTPGGTPAAAPTDPPRHPTSGGGVAAIRGASAPPTVTPPPGTTSGPAADPPSSDRAENAKILGALVGVALVVVATFIVYPMFTTRVGLSPWDTEDDSSFMIVECGTQIEWVIGGGPAIPKDAWDLDAADARSMCHAEYDDDLAGWRARFFGGIALGLVGLAIAGMFAKSFRDES